MLKRVTVLVVAVTSLAALAGPVSGAEVYRLRATASAISVSFTNVPDGEKDTLPPGEYFITDVFGARQLAVGDGTYEYNYVCVISARFAIDGNGDWIGEGGVFACGQAQTLTVDRRFNTGRLVATIEVNDCAAWDDLTGECLEPVVGTIDVDLTLTGFGKVYRSRGTSTYGTAGLFSYVYHDVSTQRAAIPSGTVTLDGAPLIDGATSVTGTLIDASGGWVEVTIGG